jgi:nucleoside-diphosphate-sugar epimerase
MKILITGASGYVGSVLTNYLLDKNFKIIAIDTQWFGINLKKHKNLKIIKKDYRKINNKDLKKVDSVIHLANIANDPGAELNPQLSWNINVLGVMRLLELCKKNKIKQFIYASSGSVYGIKKERKVTENLSLLPISLYNKTKMIAERILMSYSKNIKIHIIRPATVCGFSKRLRLDVSVNMLTYQALKFKKITVLGGKQIRPNLHIQDMVRIYYHFLKNKKIPNGCYNAGFENTSIIDLAKKIQKKLNCKIIIKKSNDPRSYRLNSDKLMKTGFKQKYFIEDGINELIKNLKLKKVNKNNFTVQKMKDLNLDS